MTGQFFAKLNDITFYGKVPLNRSRIFQGRIRLMERGTEEQTQQFEQSLRKDSMWHEMLWSENNTQQTTQYEAGCKIVTEWRQT